MCPVHAEQGNSRRIRAQGIQNRCQKNSLLSTVAFGMHMNKENEK